MPCLLQHAQADLLGLPDRELEDRVTVLLHVVHPVVDRLVRGRHAAAAGGHAQGRAAAAIDLVREPDDRRLPFRRRRQHHGPGAVAEQHARRPVGIVDDARHHVGADDQRVVVRAARHHLHADGQRIGEARARGAEIEAPCLGRADLVLQHARRAREDGVRRRRADDDEADVRGGDACLAQRAKRRFAGQIRGCRPGSTTWRSRMPVRCRIHSFAGLDHPFEIRVREETRRHVGRQPGDLDRPQGLGRRTRLRAVLV